MTSIHGVVSLTLPEPEPGSWKLLAKPRFDEQTFKTAQVFPSVIDEGLRIKRHLCSTDPNISKIAKFVYNLTKQKPKLSEWSGWFSLWTKRGGSTGSRGIMRNVGQVLVDWYKFKRPRRKRYATAGPRGYLEYVSRGRQPCFGNDK